MSIQFVKSVSDFEAYLSNNKYVVINFTASWCGPCQAVKPVVDQIYTDASEKYIGVEVIRVDLDSQQQLAARYKVSSVPTFVFVEDKKEVSRVTGANIPELLKSLESLNEKAKRDNVKRKGSGSTFASSGTATSPLGKEISPYIPKGYAILNETIHFGEFESLNVQPLYKNDSGSDVKNVFKLDKKSSTSFVYTDADSQSLFYVPLMNISKVYSILIKATKPETGGREDLSLDQEELSDETQNPSTVKVWLNQHAILSFDDASQDNNPPHVESISEFKEDGWYEIKLKFVRFQNVQSLNIFIEGDDEDYHTLIEKIVIVGINGESKEQGKIQKGDEE